MGGEEGARSGGNLDGGEEEGPRRGINNDERAKGQSGAWRVYVTMPHYAYEYKCTLGGGRNKCRPQRIPWILAPFLLHAALPGGTTKIKGQSPRRRPVFLPFLLLPLPLSTSSVRGGFQPPPSLSFFPSLCFSRGRDHEWHRAAARHKRIIKIK